jgi:hypothetical protein
VCGDHAAKREGSSKKGQQREKGAAKRAGLHPYKLPARDSPHQCPILFEIKYFLSKGCERSEQKIRKRGVRAMLSRAKERELMTTARLFRRSPVLPPSLWLLLAH